MVVVVVVGGVKKSSCVDLSQETVAARNVKGGEEISAERGTW